jgi:hypothetical protein
MDLPWIFLSFFFKKKQERNWIFLSFFSNTMKRCVFIIFKTKIIIKNIKTQRFETLHFWVQKISWETSPRKIFCNVRISRYPDIQISNYPIT